MNRTEYIKRSSYLPTQWAFLTCSAYLHAFVGGLGSGKTYIFLRKVYKQHITRDANKTNSKGRTHGLIVYPTFGLAEELFIGPFMELLESRGIRYKYDQKHHRFTTRYGSINIYQLTTPQRIVGSSYTFAGFDEFDIGSWKNCHMAFTKTTGRMRGCSHPEIFFVTSPEGTHYMYHLFVAQNEDGKRVLFQAKSTDNFHLPDNYIRNMEETYDERTIQAYRDGRFVNLTQGQVYHAYGEHNVGQVTIDPRLPVAIMCDFNRGSKPMSWNVGQVQGDRVLVKLALAKHYTNTFDMCEYLQGVLYEALDVKQGERLPELHFYGDYSGHKETSNSTKNDWEIIENHFSNLARRVVVLTRPCHSVRDQVSGVNAMLKNAKGQVRITIDPDAKVLLRDMELTTWDGSGMREDQSNDDRSHSSSALRYMIDYEFPMRDRVVRH